MSLQILSEVVPCRFTIGYNVSSLKSIYSSECPPASFVVTIMIAFLGVPDSLNLACNGGLPQDYGQLSQGVVHTVNLISRCRALNEPEVANDGLRLQTTEHERQLLI